MKCERCQKNPARVRVDELIDGRRVSHFLCQSCVDELMSAFNPVKEPTQKTEENSLPTVEATQSQEQDSRNIFQQLQTIDDHLKALDEKLHQLQATGDNHTTLLTQILARLSENPPQQ